MAVPFCSDTIGLLKTIEDNVNTVEEYEKYSLNFKQT